MSPKKPLTRLTRILLATLLLVSCASTAGNQGLETRAPLAGMIYDTDNRPVRGAVVTVDGSEETRTDVNGRFVTPPLDEGTHELSVRKEGFEPRDLTADFTSPLEVLYISLRSFDSLLDDAETAIDDEEYQQALALLDRGEKIYPDDPALLMLWYVVFSRTGNRAEAARYAAKAGVKAAFPE